MCRQGWRTLPTTYISAIFKVLIEPFQFVKGFHKSLDTTLLPGKYATINMSIYVAAPAAMALWEGGASCGAIFNSFHQSVRC